MNPTEYVAGVLKTESKPSAIHLGPVAVHALLGLMIQTANLADIAKKAIFYGDKKPIDPERLRKLGLEISDLGHFFANTSVAELTDPLDRHQYVEEDLPFAMTNTDGINKRLLHVGIGVFTEAGEILEALVKSWETGEPVDRVNLGEELGDAFWYLGVGSDELKIPFEVLFEQNNVKLLDKENGRYKQGSFDVDGAINRSVSNERVLLEGSLGAGQVAQGFELSLAQGANGQTYVAGFVPTEGDSLVIDPVALQPVLKAPKQIAQLECPLVATQNPHIFYNAKTEQFDLFDESGLLHDSYESFNEARQRQDEYVKQLNGEPTTGGILGKLKAAGEETVELVKQAFNKGDKQ